ncbi:response regulator [Paracrocinitomix mangrovi]|uniref:LytR/AlgR family response regulator transcription factor n=1 Tax=Paracrocinitomix mangrovi TaxID=2862509 RepID=UPI001C8D3BAE|nr:response regulator [Paracrocinitomix mangrovi]UKN01165.1 response regulator [Paracrocinitomix mangrovi]
MTEQRDNYLDIIIVDDEQHAIKLLKNVLNLFPNNVRVVGEATDLPQAVQLINQTKPHAVFMDINMPKYSGLQVNDFFDENRDFKLVYVTAHSQHAIEALRIQAFDYILKPIEKQQLERCIERLNTFFDQEREQVKEAQISATEKKVAINSHQGIQYLNLDEIDFVEASGMYSVVHTDNKQIIVSKPLKSFEFLTKNGFYRVHRSFLINTQKVKRYSKVDVYEIEMLSGARIPVSRNKKEEFVRFMREFYSG